LTRTPTLAAIVVLETDDTGRDGVGVEHAEEEPLVSDLAVGVLSSSLACAMGLRAMPDSGSSTVADLNVCFGAFAMHSVSARPTDVVTFAWMNIFADGGAGG
jgi:hypothetical protein